MRTYQFKTNINCGGCLDKVSSYLDNAQEIFQWQVDTAAQDNVLTVTGNDTLASKDIVDIINLAGLSAKPVRKNVLSKIFGT